MNAQEAAARSKAAETRFETEAFKKREQEEAATKQRVAKILPELVAAAMKEIEKAVSEGRTFVSISSSEDAYGALAHALSKEGYQTETSESRDNYGDSAAPCMITTHWVKVTWRQSRERR
jgi:ribosomal protein S19